MAKQCNKDECTNPRFGGGFCVRHQYLRTDKKQKPLKRTQIKPISDKRKRQNAVYSKNRLEYLNKNPRCEFKGCNKHATEIHHKNERTNERLNDTEHFMSICRDHHIWIHANPKQAREMNYL